MDTFFFRLALMAYLLSSFGYMASLFAKRVLVAKISTWLLLAAFLVHTMSFGARCLATHQSPISNIYDALSFFAWVMAGIYLAFQIWTKTRVLGVFVAPVVVILLIVASVGLGGQVALPFILKGHLVSAHVILSVVGEALLTLAGLAAAMYLLQDRHIRTKKITRLSRLLPPLKDLDSINHGCLLWGFPLLTVGLIIGSIWARTAWGSHWQWDPKQIWTLLAWIIYGFLLHQRLALGRKGRRMAILSLAAIGILFVTFMGVECFFPSLHTFN